MRLRSLARHGGGALADQILFSGSNLLLTIALARTLEPSAFGLFSVIYAGVVLVNFLHVAVVTEPATVFIADHQSETAAFSASVFRLNLWLSLGLAVASMLVALPFVGSALTPADLAALGACLIVLCAYWTVRQLRFARREPWRAAAATTVYTAVMIGGAVLFLVTRDASLSAGLWTMALAGAAATVAGVVGPGAGRGALLSRTPGPRLSREMFHYSGWSLVSAVLIWVFSNAYFVTLPMFSTLAESGSLRALLNLTLPFQQAVIAAGLVTLPYLSRLVKDGHAARARRATGMLVVAGAVGGLGFSAVLYLAGPLLYSLFYGDSLVGDPALIVYALALPVLWAVTGMARVALRALRRPKAIVACYLAAFAVSAIAIPLGSQQGAWGAVIGMTAMNGVLALCLAWPLLTGFSAKPSQPPA